MPIAHRPRAPDAIGFAVAAGASSSDNLFVAGDEHARIVVRMWDRRDRDAVEGLLRLLSADADVTAEDAPTFVAVDGEEVVGMVTLCTYTTLTGTKAYLDHLVVSPGSRRQGIGRALVSHAIGQAQNAGASRIDLTAGDRKHAGRALYQSLGFRKRDSGIFRLQL